MDSIKPQLSIWEFSRAEPHSQYKSGKLGRRGRFCYWYFFSAWPFCGLSTWTIPTCLMWLCWPEQWFLRKPLLRVQFSGHWRERWRNNPFCNMRFKQGCLGGFYQTCELPCYTAVTKAIKWPSLTTEFNLFFPLDCCLVLTVQKWFRHVITMNVVLNCDTVC